MDRFPQSGVRVDGDSALVRSFGPNERLPDWIRSYLQATASKLMEAVFSLDPKAALALVPQALGFSREGGKVIADAKAFWAAPVIYGTYERLKEIAPTRNRADWALEELCRIFGLHSRGAAKR